MRSKRFAMLFSLLVLLSLIAAQCGGGAATEAPPAATEAPATEEPAPEPEEPAPEPEQVDEFACEDPIGCVDVAPGDPIRVGYALVISGPNETLGVDSRRGVEIAISDKPEVLGRPVELVGEDALCSAEGGQTALTKLVSDPSLVGIIGTNCSSAGEPASKIASDAGMVLISPSNTAPSLTDPDGTWNPGYLRTAHNDNVQGASMAEFVYNELGLRKAATIHDGSPYADQLQQVFADRFVELGGEITTQEAVNVGDTDMRPVLTKISATEPELIYYPIFIAEGAFITTQAKEVAGLEDVALGGADGMISPDFLEAAGEAAEGMYHSGPDLAHDNPLGQAFLAKHQEVYGEPPLSAFHAHAYDAAMILMAAIEQVAVEDEGGALHIPRQALRDALYATSNFEGITGTLNCNETGDCADPLITVNQVRDGAYTPMWTQGVGMLEAAGPAMVEEYTCDDAIGCVEVAPGDPIRVGYALVISGPNETLGVDSRRGVEIAISDKPEVLGRPVELVGEDALCSAEGGQTALTKLVSDPSLVGIIGTNCSSAGEPASKIASDAGMVLISPSNTAPSLTDPDGTWNPGYLRTAHNDNVQGASMAEFVYNELGLRKAATIHDGSPYADQLQQVFADKFVELGGEITTQEAINVGDTDMRPVLTKISATEPELIYYPIFIAEGAFITTQAKEVAGLEDVALGGADGMISPDFLEAAGEAAEGMYHSGPDLAHDNPLGQAFLAKHQEVYGEPPLSAFHAHAYDAAMILMAAIEQVAVEDASGALYIPRQALRDALYATSNFEGITGTLNCNETGDCADPLITVNQVRDGAYTPIWTQGVGLLE